MLGEDNYGAGLDLWINSMNLTFKFRFPGGPIAADALNLIEDALGIVLYSYKFGDVAKGKILHPVGRCDPEL